MEFLEKKMYVYKAIVERHSPSSSQKIADGENSPSSQDDGVCDLNIIPYRHIHPITLMY